MKISRELWLIFSNYLVYKYFSSYSPFVKSNMQSEEGVYVFQEAKSVNPCMNDVSIQIPNIGVSELCFSVLESSDSKEYAIFVSCLYILLFLWKISFVKFTDIFFHLHVYILLKFNIIKMEAIKQMWIIIF